MGVEGCITSPGFDYESVTHDREQFLARTEAQALYAEVHELCEGLDVPFYNNPLFHEFLQGKRSYRCSAWSMPTYTVEGWRSPCYLLADAHVGSLKELYEGTDWEAYGTDRDPRCANCLMHCGYEATHHPRGVQEPEGPADARAGVGAGRRRSRWSARSPAERRALAGLERPGVEIHVSGMGADAARGAGGAR